MAMVEESVGWRRVVYVDRGEARFRCAVDEGL